MSGLRSQAGAVLAADAAAQRPPPPQQQQQHQQQHRPIAAKKTRRSAVPGCVEGAGGWQLRRRLASGGCAAVAKHLKQ
jgi:hypothetical protein